MKEKGWNQNPEATRKSSEAAAGINIGADVQKDGIRIAIVGAGAMNLPHLQEVVKRLSEAERVKTVTIVKSSSCGMTEAFPEPSSIELIGLQKEIDKLNLLNEVLPLQNILDDIPEERFMAPVKKKRPKKYWERQGFGGRG